MAFLKRYRFVLIFLLNLILISAAYGMSIGHSHKNDPASVAKEKATIDHYQDALSAIEDSYDGTKYSEWLQAVQKTAKVMSDNHFTYNRKGIKSTLDDALKDNRHGDCAHLISWALQEYGILDAGETFYSDSNGSLSCKKDSKTFAHLNEKCEIIDAGGISCSDIKKLKDILHVGDICCYNKHMNVIAGINEKGDILYYDAGLVPTEKKEGKIYYTEKLTLPFPRKTKTFRKYKLHTVIRVREK